jgi:putative zinc finger protein
MSIHRESEQLSAYLDGELDAAERRAIESHLSGCAACSTTLQALRATTADLRALPAAEPTPQQSWVLRATLRRARRPWLARYARVVAAAAGVALIGSAIAFATLSGGKHGSLSSGAQTLAVGNAAISIQNTNFNASSARALLSGSANAGGGTFAGSEGAATAPQAGAPAAATPLSKDKRTGGSAALGPAPVQGSSIDYSEQIKTCERQVLARSRDPARALQYIVASYDKTPAFLLVYELPADRPNRSEVWVVRRTDCSVLYFAQHPRQ